VRFVPHLPPVGVDPVALFRVIEEGFAERRKTMANALRRLGVSLPDASRILIAGGVDPATRAEEIGLEGFARITESLLAQGWRP
jgi:16S rRNA (adenine1518-N6/adenine1519-N6)-dimethyltransferase